MYVRPSVYLFVCIAAAYRAPLQPSPHVFAHLATLRLAVRPCSAPRLARRDYLATRNTIEASRGRCVSLIPEQTWGRRRAFAEAFRAKPCCATMSSVCTLSRIWLLWNESFVSLSLPPPLSLSLSLSFSLSLTILRKTAVAPSHPARRPSVRPPARLPALATRVTRA